MMVSFEFLSQPIILNENQIQVLCIENQKLFRDVTGALITGEIEENHIVFSKDFAPLKFKGNILVVDDFFHLSYTGAIIKKLYEQIEEYCIRDYLQETLELKTHLVKFMDTIVKSFDYDFDYHCDVALSELFKAMGLSPLLNDGDLLDRFIDYVLILNKYAPPKCFVFFNLHLYFTPDEISLLYNDLLQRHIKVLAIENTKFFEKNEFENIVVYDNDFCEIIEN